MKNYFLEIFTESFLYLVLTDYLKIKDIKNLSYVSNNYFNNEMNFKMRNYVIKQKSSYIIYRFISNSYKTFRNLIISNILDILFEKTNGVDKNFKKMYALYLTKTYPYYKEWYNFDVEWKLEIINRYKKVFTNNPTRYNFFNLIKNMNNNEISSIGI